MFRQPKEIFLNAKAQTDARVHRVVYPYIYIYIPGVQPTSYKFVKLSCLSNQISAGITGALHLISASTNRIYQRGRADHRFRAPPASANLVTTNEFPVRRRGRVRVRVRGRNSSLSVYARAETRGCRKISHVRDRRRPAATRELGPD